MSFKQCFWVFREFSFWYFHESQRWNNSREACTLHHWMLVEEVLIHLTRLDENFSTPQWGFEVIIAKSLSLQQSLPQLYGLSGRSFVIKIALTSPASSYTFSTLVPSPLFLLAFSCLTVLPSHLTRLPVFVVSHRAVLLRSSYQLHTDLLAYTLKVSCSGVWLQ